MGARQLSAAPNITGGFDAGTFAGTTNGTGAFLGSSAPYNWATRGTYTAGYGAHYPFSASNSNSVYQNVSEIRPDNYAVMFCIKY